MGWSRRRFRYLGYTLEATRAHDGWRVFLVDAPQGFVGDLPPARLMRDAQSQAKGYMRRHPKQWPNRNPIDTGALRRSITCNIL